MNEITLVTGAPGWLGTRLVEALLGRAPELTQYASRGARPVRALTIPGVDASPLTAMGAEVAIGDVRKPETLAAAMQGVDTVFHLAGLIHPKKISELYEINTEGTKNMLAAAKAAGVRRFIHISSNSPAGCNRKRHVLMKESDPKNPYKGYGKSKALAEEAVNAAHQEGVFETVILRPCWFYGPNQPERQSRFFKMIQAGHPIVFGDGNNLRSMSYIDNSVQGMLLAESTPHAAGQTYWIADERPYSTLEIYETVADILGVTNFKPRHIPGLTSEVCELIDDILQAAGMYITEFHVAGEMNKDIACSIDKAKRELGYRPTVDLREGMRRSIEWCRMNGQL